MSPQACTDTKTKVEGSPVAERPPRFKVLLLNDDYTTMEFVVMVLRQVFSKTSEQAFTIMMHVHRNGLGLAGVYTYDVAEMKCITVHRLAREHGFPLRCGMEPE